MRKYRWKKLSAVYQLLEAQKLVNRISNESMDVNIYKGRPNCKFIKGSETGTKKFIFNRTGQPNDAD